MRQFEPVPPNHFKKKVNKMKICSSCKKEKELNMFYKNGIYYKPNCKKCFNEIQVSLIKKTREYAESYKVECHLCGYNKCKKALEFHHIDSKEKTFSLGNVIGRRAWSRETKKIIDLEISKCIVLCANCHREVEYGFTDLNIKEDVDKIKEL